MELWYHGALGPWSFGTTLGLFRPVLAQFESCWLLFDPFLTLLNPFGPFWPSFAPFCPPLDPVGLF